MTITEIRENGSQSTRQKFKPIGLTVTNPTRSNLQMVQSQLHAADTVKAGQGDASGMVKTRTSLQAGGTLTFNRLLVV
jgi:hypothetical protein